MLVWAARAKRKFTSVVRTSSTLLPAQEMTTFLFTSSLCCSTAVEQGRDSFCREIVNWSHSQAAIMIRSLRVPRCCILERRKFSTKALFSRTRKNAASVGQFYGSLLCPSSPLSARMFEKCVENAWKYGRSETRGEG